MSKFFTGIILELAGMLVAWLEKRSVTTGGNAPANAEAAKSLNDRLAAWRKQSGAPLAIIALAGLLCGCAANRVVFVPDRDAPVRAGPDMRGKVYTWTGSA